ncbi:nac transcription factor 25 [Nicotiana attenuata]|uniref:Nac transcription factor 25 n=1 Tax=Nicotiana attenuata TaxID=49451 RepID=A0A314KWZ2_NICAT|nr:nac transcription factor 25 [Nicotiana attenuata]
MENHHSSSSPTNNANISKGNLTDQIPINELPVTAVLSNNNKNGEITSAEEIDAYINNFPPGYRFNPTDSELVTYYLKRKLDNLPLYPNRIYEINIYKYNPELIAAHVKPTTEEKEWYILTPRDRKYRNGNRPNRAAGDGYWKATGADKQIKDNKNVIIGLKKSLVYYIGKPPKGDKTNWIMHEYRVPDIPNLAERDINDWKLDEWVLCRIYKKSGRDNTMITQRKRIRDAYETKTGRGNSNDSVQDFNDDGQFGESSDGNLSNEFANITFEATSQDSTRHDSINCIQDTLHSNNRVPTFHPQVPTRFGNFPKSCVPEFCDMPWSTTTAYDYQSCVPGFNEGFVTNDKFHYPPSPMKIEPISSMMANNNFIGQDDNMKSKGFGDIPCFSSCIGGYLGQDYEYMGLEKLDSGELIDQYLVNCEMVNSTMYLPEYNMKNLVNGESSQSNTISGK